MADLRCPSKKHGELLGHSTIEVKCNSRFCGAEDGAVVLHRFDSNTGELLATSTFKDPQKGQAHASQHHPTSVRSA